VSSEPRAVAGPRRIGLHDLRTGATETAFAMSVQREHETATARSAQMRGSTRRDTKPEKAIRSALHSRGLRFRVDKRVWSGAGAPRPDLVFGPQKVAVFVDGCFWHSCPLHCRHPTQNQEYWQPKLARNRERDRQNDAALRAAGWSVLRVWEHESPEEAAEKIEAAVRARR
jgi:DNA mismatch endonuclease, patch repair protein